MAALRDAVRRARHRRRLRQLAGPRLLEAFAQTHPRAVFVEIGSNDGEQHDHLRPHILARDWTGVMVEPVRYVFERLRRNYAGVPGVRLANVAVAETDGTVEFFHLAAPPEDLAAAGLPDWYDGIGSLSREHLLGHRDHFPDLEDRLVASEIEALSYASLLARFGLDRVDLLVIDAEGHDARIVRSIDFAADPPRLVVYEHFHLTRAERHAAAAHLRAAGYELMEEGFDTFALLPADDALTRSWRQLRPAVPGVAAEDA